MKMYAQIAVAPFAGLAFAIFLPAIGILMTVYILFRKLVPHWGVRYDPCYNYFCRK